MISLADYFGPWINHRDATAVVIADAEHLLERVNSLLDVAFGEVESHINPTTGTYISGQTYGGFRPQSCPQGAPQSSHKAGRGIDIYDPGHTLANWCFHHQAIVKIHGLYMEHPDSTPGWCHLTDRAPKSCKICFMP